MDGEITGHDGLIVGSPTCHTGKDDQNYSTTWYDWLYRNLPSLDLQGKKVAVFGCSNQNSYNDYHCDAVGEIYDIFSVKGCKMYGMAYTDGYGI